MAQRERAVSTVKRMIGDEAERQEKAQEELKRKENRRVVRTEALGIFRAAI